MLDDVTCPVFSILLLIFCLKLLRKTANIIEKTSVYHIVNGNCALFHTSKTATRSQAVARIADRTSTQQTLVISDCC